MKNKFDFYDVVIVTSTKTKLQSINGKKGIIRGVSQHEENLDVFGYAVDILDEIGKVEDGWFILEEDLKGTGEKANPKDFEFADTLRIRVDPKTGKGEIIEDEEE